MYWSVTVTTLVHVYSHLITSHHNISSHLVTSHHISSHLITYHHNISSHLITSHQISSQLIATRHVSSRLITSHHISSHRIISHHISSHLITSHHNSLLLLIVSGSWTDLCKLDISGWLSKHCRFTLAQIHKLFHVHDVQMTYDLPIGNMSLNGFHSNRCSCLTIWCWVSRTSSTTT
jgi:hypothetical protein